MDLVIYTLVFWDLGYYHFVTKNLTIFQCANNVFGLTRLVQILPRKWHCVKPLCMLLASLSLPASLWPCCYSIYIFIPLLTSLTKGKLPLIDILCYNMKMLILTKLDKSL